MLLLPRFARAISLEPMLAHVVNGFYAYLERLLTNYFCNGYAGFAAFAALSVTRANSAARANWRAREP